MWRFDVKMFNLILFLGLGVASSVVLTAVIIEEPQDLCSELEFPCGGRCVSLSAVCDGRRDCADGSDEEPCWGSGALQLGRAKRQAGSCTKLQWQCRDGSCISFDGKCDGVVNCPDGSDETFPLCRWSHCQSNWFRCTYGACVDGTAPCNGIQECADNSDELLPACRNEVTMIRGQFKCNNGQKISASQLCDGVADCTDASDESVAACAGKLCPVYLFQCAYGACVDAGSDCNGKKECYDGSDESEELCNVTSIITTEPTITQKPVKGGACVLPPFPKHGSYVVSGVAKPSPGMAFSSVVLNITCQPGYDISGRKDRLCYEGIWSGDINDCVHFCRLAKHPSVEYRCLLDGDAEGTRECNLYEPAGTIVRPECKSPNYYYSGVLTYMRCIDGSWDYIARCLPGLTKNGTNITILIKERDQYEVHIGSFEYTVSTEKPGYGQWNNPRRPGTQNPSHNSEMTGVKPVVSQVTPVTPAADVDYDIDETDWRIGVDTDSQPPNLNVLGLNSNRNNNNFALNANGVDFNLKNKSVVINAPKDKVQIYKDRIFYRN